MSDVDGADLPPLYHQGKLGEIWSWRVWTEADEICTETGMVNGSKQYFRKRAEPKNVGRGNETTPEEQAIKEAASMWQAKLDVKYSRTIEGAMEFKPMAMLALSEPFEKARKRIYYPCDVQPKLDGNRALAYWRDKKVVLLSRNNKFWDLPRISSAIEEFLPEDAMLDGELYRHGYSCQQMTKLIHGTQSELVQYHAYDVPRYQGEEHPWIERRRHLVELVKMSHAEAQFFEIGVVARVETFEVDNEDEIRECQSSFIKAGYEGAIVRLHRGEYEWGARSQSLIKAKTFDDHEFKVVGFKGGKGKNENTVTWVCELNDGSGRTFDCSPTGSYSERARMLVQGRKYVGKMLKVKHFAYTDAGFPRFPVGIMFREGNE